MLSKSRRVSTKLFNEIIQSRSILHSPFFRFVFVKNKDIQDIGRFAFVPSKKVASQAVDRNYLRRKSQAAFRQVQKEIESSHNLFRNGYSGIFFIKKEAYKASLPQLKLTFQEFNKALGDLK